MRAPKRLLGWSLLLGTLSGAFQFAMLNRLVFHGATRGGDVLLYANSLWSMSNFDFHNYVRGTHVFAIHAHVLELLWIPAAWIMEPARVLALMQATSLGLLVGLCCQAGIDLTAQAGIIGRRALAGGGLLLAAVAIWGSPLVLNPFFFDPRPDLLGVPLLAWASLRALVHQKHDRVTLSLLGLAVLAREDFAPLAALAVALDPVTNSVTTGRRKWLLAAAFIAYALLFHFAFKPWLLGSTLDRSLQYHLDGKSGLALSAADKLAARAKILVLLALSGGGLGLIGWRWAAPAIAGSFVLLLSNWYPSVITTTHYGMFVGAGIAVCVAAGYQRTLGATRPHAKLGAACVLGAFLYLGFSTAPGAEAFDRRAYDMQARDGAFVFRLRGPVDPHFDRVYQSLRRFPADAPLAIGVGYAGPFAARPRVIAAEELTQALDRGQTEILAQYPTVALFASDRLRVGRSLVQRHGYQLAGYLGAPIDVFTRVAGLQATPWPVSARAPGDCVAQGVRFRGTGLALCDLRIGHGPSQATLCRVERIQAESGASAIELRDKTHRTRLRALEGLAYLGDLPQGRCIHVNGHAVGPDAVAVVIGSSGQIIPADK